MNAYAKPPLQGKFAFRQGAIYGVGLGVIGIIISLIARAVPAIAFVSWIIDVVVFILVGMFSAQKTGRVATGTIAGLWAGLISGIISLIWGIISLFTISASQYNQAAQRVASQGHMSQQAMMTTLIVAGIIGLIVGLGIDLGIGAGFGAIGGVIGKNRAKTPPPAEYQEAPYPGAANYAGEPLTNPYQGTQSPYATPGGEPTVQANNPYQGSANPESTPNRDPNAPQQY